MTFTLQLYIRILTKFPGKQKSWETEILNLKQTHIRKALHLKSNLGYTYILKATRFITDSNVWVLQPKLRGRFLLTEIIFNWYIFVTVNMNNVELIFLIHTAVGIRLTFIKQNSMFRTHAANLQWLCSAYWIKSALHINF